MWGNNSGDSGGDYYDTNIRLGLAATLASFVLLTPPAFVLSRPNPFDGSGAVLVIWFGAFGILLFGFAVNFYLVAITNRPSLDRRRQQPGEQHHLQYEQDSSEDDAEEYENDGTDEEDERQQVRPSDGDGLFDLSANAKEYGLVRPLRSFVFVLCNRADSKLTLRYWKDEQGFKEKDYDVCIELLARAGVVVRPGAGAAPRFADGYNRQAPARIWAALNELCGYDILKSLEMYEGTKVNDYRTYRTGDVAVAPPLPDQS